ncbi:hypothetical protein [Hirschia baltica]|uniref:DUF423 domain-containing protein n=1 Tax=Hirschia baltica (strain ATCC 49814 / DSM 5838 / IFAM 1418) TaxID=582402 RepID=C6XNX9_HIRBI|nr:hypothetical protein [Hirschia baltica]ACT60159.1 conserved hypothetical protein [Hirschia baltica ATCC 49814]
MNSWILAASIAAFGVLILHVFVGGKLVAKPLLKGDAAEAQVRYTQYFCWHVVTIWLAVLAVGLGYAACHMNSDDIAILLSGGAILSALWGLILPPAVKQKYSQMPQGVMYVLIGAPGLYGALAL